MKTLLGIFALMIMSGCSNHDDAVRALKSAGYSNVQTQGYSWFACGQDDTYHTKFTALNPAGRQTSGVVCSGLFFKSSTIRH